MNIKYPEIKVQLSGHDGNAFNVIGRVQRALRSHHIPEKTIREFQAECTSSGSYDKLLQVCMNWVDVE